MKITVVGLGKIGLPLAVKFALSESDVTGLDVSQDVVNKVNNGQEPFPGEIQLSEHLGLVLERGLFSASTSDEESLKTADVVVVCIPLVIDSSGAPDFRNIDELVKKIGMHIKPETLICFETTLPVGTTRNRFGLAIEKYSGLVIGEDVFIVFSPERVLTGRVFQDLKRYPKLVGGVTSACTQKGISFYSKVLDFENRADLIRPNGVWPLSSSEAAEFAKIAETTYRDVNIGLANEFAQYAYSKNIDMLEVIEACNSQPYSNIHTPGISVGGHCIPVYPKFYIWDNPFSSIVKAARNQNENMPATAVNRILDFFGPVDDFKILILGVSYRPAVREEYFSGAVQLLHLLESLGAKVYGHDPLYEGKELQQLGFEVEFSPEELDGIILHTNHVQYKDLDLSRYTNIKFFYDGRNTHRNFEGDTRFQYFSM